MEWRAVTRSYAAKSYAVRRLGTVPRTGTLQKVSNPVGATNVGRTIHRLSGDELLEAQAASELVAPLPPPTRLAARIFREHLLRLESLPREYAFLLLRQEREPALDPAQPGGCREREMHVIAAAWPSHWRMSAVLWVA